MGSLGHMRGSWGFTGRRWNLRLGLGLPRLTHCGPQCLNYDDYDRSFCWRFGAFVPMNLRSMMDSCLAFQPALASCLLRWCLVWKDLLPPGTRSDRPDARWVGSRTYTLAATSNLNYKCRSSRDLPFHEADEAHWMTSLQLAFFGLVVCLLVWINDKSIYTHDCSLCCAYPVDWVPFNSPTWFYTAQQVYAVQSMWLIDRFNPVHCRAEQIDLQEPLLRASLDFQASFR